MTGAAGEGESPRIAALPMYDFPELQDAHDQLWAALARRLVAGGVSGVPKHLARDLGHRETWRDPGLLFGQACEYPILKSFRESLRMIARPRYTAPGCDGESYRSAVLVRVDNSADCLADLRNGRCVVNEPDSNSGMNLFRAALAPVAGGSRFFSSIRFSGSHRRSVELLAASEADVTAVDCVTFAHLQRLRPALTAYVKVIGWTPSSPSLPFVTSQLASEVTCQALRSAIKDVFDDSLLAQVRELLLLGGVDLAPDPGCTRILELEREAERWRYPTLL
jgi:ABC-type phosphate/phosphonate transport system substrate-binding protein